MKSSRYNILVDCPETGETILYNSLYGSLAVLGQGEMEAVERVLAETDQPEDSNIKTVLVEQRHLVEDSMDEIAIVENRKTLGIKDDNRLDIVIMPTLDCNFDCTYCYEVHRPSRMTDETETAIRRWLAAQVPRYEFVMLHWYGGEPLLGYDRVVSISRYVRDVALESGISYSTHITTNGYLLNRERIRELISSEIYDFQITVDGPPEIHDTLRVLTNGKGTFNRVFKNINSLARADERLKISLRINFNHSNLPSIPELLEMFPLDVRPHLRVVYEPIFGECSLSATENLPSQQISEAMSQYYRLAEQLGYDVVLGMAGIHAGRLVYCYAERENQFIVNYNGDVHKCSVSEFLPEDRVGYIRTDGVLVKEDEKWNRWVGADLFEERCYSCTYLPLCMGGCRRMRLERKGTGSYCCLVPTNASYLLKQVVFGGFAEVLRREG